MDFKGQKVIITGGSRGIGYGIAEAFLLAGADIAICGTNEASLKAAKENLIKAAAQAHIVPQGKVLTYKADVSKQADCEGFVDAVIKEYGAIDVLVNNAGITKDTLVLRMSEADFDSVININLKGTFLMSKAAAKHMLKARGGAVINMSSVVGQSGNGGQVNYSASKAGIIGLTKSMAKEFASRGVRVNAVAPGFVKTDMTDKLSAEIKEAVLESIPLKRFAEVSDIARAVMFLASQNDAGYITGQTLAVNGGLYI